MSRRRVYCMGIGRGTYPTKLRTLAEKRGSLRNACIDSTFVTEKIFTRYCKNTDNVNTPGSEPVRVMPHVSAHF
ncbi:hypothetical protein BaRGS_00014600 [Batillaria attramentaria]|uniref:Uncharacterized protein n=1 Tax=Batillaria attramentaria TaxID=370345 RepID=A0ABD0L4Z4_9CAEN